MMGAKSLFDVMESMDTFRSADASDFCNNLIMFSVRNVCRHFTSKHILQYLHVFPNDNRIDVMI